MTHRFRLLAVATLASALALAGCKKGADESSAPNAAPGSNTAAVSGPVAAPAGGWTEQVVQTAEGGYRMGNPNAATKLVEYGSRTCPHCAHLAEQGMPDIKKMVATGKLSYEFRDFPIHPMDTAAILLGQCNGPSTFFPILEAMFANQDAVFAKVEPGKLPQGFEASLQGKPIVAQTQIWADYLGYTAFVGQRGVPEAKAKACLADPKAYDAMSQHLNAATQAGVDSTPFFFLNGESQGSQEWSSLKPKLTAAVGG
jgi:protein-disulfide isomerase